MRFSIVVPVYNAKDTLSRCIDAALSQSFSDFELLLIDDGSTDGSGKLLDAAAARDSRVQVLHGKNAGPLLARRRAILAARGEFLVFCDADDALMPGALASIDARLGKTRADMLYYGYLHDKGGRETPVPPPFPDGTVLSGKEKQALYRCMAESSAYNMLWNKALRTALMQADETDYEALSDIRCGEDLLLLLDPLTKAERIAFCEKPLYRYVVTPGSLTKSAGDAMFAQRTDLRVTDALLLRLADWDVDTEEVRDAVLRRVLRERVNAAWLFFRGADGREAKKKALLRDWLRGIPRGADFSRAVKKLEKKDRIQVRCMEKKQNALLYLLLEIRTIRLGR